MKRAVAYLRVSTEEQSQRQLPIEGQREAGLRLIAANGWQFVAEYSDPGISGTFGPDRRPGLAALIAAAKRGELDVVVLWDDSRLARDLSLYWWIRWELGAVEVVTVTAPTASRLETGLRSIVADEANRQSRAATSRGVRANLRRGGRHGTDAFGYRWEGATRAILEEEASVIRDLYARLLAGESIRSLVARTGWHHAVLKFRLRNPLYAGGRVIGRRLGGSGRRVPVPQAQWEIVWDLHEPIIPREQWDRVQTILDGCKARPREGRIALSGLLWCEACNRRLRLANWRDVRGGRRFWFVCLQCKERHGLMRQTSRVVSRVALELAAPNLAQRIATMLAEQRAAGETSGATKAEIRRLERARQALLDLIVSGSVTDTRALGDRLEAIQRELRAAERKLAETEQARPVPTLAEIEAMIQRIAGKAEAVADHPEIDYAARPLLHALVERIDVSEAALVIRPGEIVEGLGPLASLGITWRLDRAA